MHRRLPAAFLFNDTATTEIYTLSLHDALPISVRDYTVALIPTDRSKLTMRSRWLKTGRGMQDGAFRVTGIVPGDYWVLAVDRKSTRLNSSHGYISYAVFCLKKKIKVHTA